MLNERENPLDILTDVIKHTTDECDVHGKRTKFKSMHFEDLQDSKSNSKVNNRLFRMIQLYYLNVQKNTFDCVNQKYTHIVQRIH